MSILTTEIYCLGFAAFRRKHLRDKKSTRTKLSHSNAGAHHYHISLISCTEMIVKGFFDLRRQRRKYINEEWSNSITKNKRVGSFPYRTVRPCAEILLPATDRSTSIVFFTVHTL